MPHVLLIEDDAAIRAALIRGLSERGHAVSSVGTGMAGLEQAVNSRPDTVVLDLGLPDVDGRTVLRMLRGASKVPVVVATARDDESEIVALLNAGADDYVVKPFSAAQLDARIRAVLRRGGEQKNSQVVEVGQLRIDPRTREATLEGRPLDLTPREFALLHYLTARAGEVISKRELLAEVWQLPYGGADKTVDVHLSWLRRKLGETAHEPRYLHSIRGVGVRIAAPEG
ncbi:response regulator transcription factor [Thermocrispum sp.]|uniref:response regulator transcription factor n=1 Tax=Thermocrispum sp. TaxID=2060768 RepID=UPI00257A6462|nr:response regulator transcription factor [Thermocrispum sp.]